MEPDIFWRNESVVFGSLEEFREMGVNGEYR